MILLPKGYLSSSQMDLWEKDKNEYRQRYYLGKKPPKTKYTEFGNEVHTLLENNDPSVAHIPRYDTAEREVRVEVEGVPFVAYIDSSCSETGNWLDYKTGIHPWTRSKVRNLKQLRRYEYLSRTFLGKTSDIGYLVWIETEEVLVDGIFNTLRLTGKHKVHERVFEPWEMFHAKEEIVRFAEEISDDYKQFIDSIV